MKRVTIIVHQGKSIIHTDFTNLTILPKSLLQELMNQAQEYIVKQPPSSVLILTNLTGLYYDQNIITLFTEYLVQNKPFIKASAVIGYPESLKDVLADIQKSAGRELYLFDSEREALDWLVEQ